MDNSFQPPLPVAGQRDTRIRMGSYDVLGWLGSGRYSSVYLAGDVETGCRYALKVAEGGEAAERHLRREAGILSGLSHPGLVKLHAIDEVNGRAALVLEQVEGMSLRLLLEEEKTSPGLTVAQIKSLLIGILEPVQYLHDQRIIHGDLKPENIAVSFNGSEEAQVKLLDLGLSGERGREAGTPLYMAPEAFCGELGYASDIWSTGLILFEIFHGASPVEKLHPGRPLTFELLKKTINELEPFGAAYRASVFTDSRHAEGTDCRPCLNFQRCRQKAYGAHWFCNLVNFRTDETLKTSTLIQRTMRNDMLTQQAGCRITAERLLAMLKSDSAGDGNCLIIPQSRYEPAELFCEGEHHITLRVKDIDSGDEYSLLAIPVHLEDESFRLFASLCTLHAPFFPKLVSRFQQEKRDYLVMDGMKGRSLGMIMDERPLQAGEIFSLARKLVELFSATEGLPVPLVTAESLIVDRQGEDMAVSVGGPGAYRREYSRHCEQNGWSDTEPVWNIGALIYRLFCGKTVSRAEDYPHTLDPRYDCERDSKEAFYAMSRLASRGEGFPSYLFYQEEHADCLGCETLSTAQKNGSQPHGALCGGKNCRQGNFRILRFRFPIPAAMLLWRMALVSEREKRCNLKTLDNELSRIEKLGRQIMESPVWIPPLTLYRLDLHRTGSSPAEETESAARNLSSRTAAPADFKWLPDELKDIPSFIVQGSERLQELTGAKLGERDRFMQIYGWDDYRSGVTVKGLPANDAALSRLLAGWHISLGRQLREEGYVDQALQEYERALFVSQHHQQVIEDILLMKCLLGEASGAQSRSEDRINDLPGLLSYIESIMAR